MERRDGFWPLLALAILSCASILQANPPLEPSHEGAAVPLEEWWDPFSPYRLRIDLAQPARGRTVLDLDAAQVIAELSRVSVDLLNDDTFAYERAVLVDPTTQQVVGRFHLVPAQPLPIDGRFDQLAGGGTSPWQGFNPSTHRFEVETVGGSRRRVMWIEKQQIENTKLYQAIDLQAGRLYLLEYWVNMDTTENGLSVTVDNPNKGYWPQLHTSYLPSLTPARQWVERRMLVRPQVTPAQLSVWTGIVGRAGIADFRLRPGAMAVDRGSSAGDDAPGPVRGDAPRASVDAARRGADGVGG